MKISDHLSEDEKKKLIQLKKHAAARKKKNPIKSIKEKLSLKDLKQLMGMNRDRYERRGGAIRRK